MERQVLIASFVELSSSQLYAILRLRSEVFVVEQHCVFLDLDGRDDEPGARHLWIDHAGEVVSYLRLLPRAGRDGRAVTEMGRVVTSPRHRSRGHGAALVRHALATLSGRVEINAQSVLVDWYRGFGFDAVGEEFTEDGIAHTPMTRS